MDEIKEYQVWVEGYAATGESGQAYRLLRNGESNTLWKGKTFKEASKNAVRECLVGDNLSNWGYYDEERNTYWACRFFDNEKDARKSFG